MSAYNKSLSKFISLILRHQPDVVKIKLDVNGWVSIETLLKGINTHSDYIIDRSTLQSIVDTNDKKRFIITEDGRKYIDMDDSKLNPCLTCGACCHYFRISFYEGELLAGFPPEELTEPLGRPYSCMKGTREGGRCVALDGAIGCQIKCLIYSKRPSVCREYEVWDELGQLNPRCNIARNKHNLNELPKTKNEWIELNVPSCF